MEQIKSTLKNYFSQSHLSSISDIINERRNMQQNEDVENAFVLSHLFPFLLFIILHLFN